MLNKLFLEADKRLTAFWRIWHERYLLSLKRSSKSFAGRNSEKTPNTGDIVIIEQDEIPRNFWRTGRILELNTGRDGLIRTVKLKVAGREEPVIRA